MGIINKLRGT